MRSSVFTKREAIVSRGEIKGERANLCEKATKPATEFQVKDNSKTVLCDYIKEFYIINRNLSTRHRNIMQKAPKMM